VVASRRLCQPLFENDQQRVSDRSAGRGEPASLETVTQILSKVTHLPLEQIKPCPYIDGKSDWLQETPSCQSYARIVVAALFRMGWGASWFGVTVSVQWSYQPGEHLWRWSLNVVPWIPISCYAASIHPMKITKTSLTTLRGQGEQLWLCLRIWSNFECHAPTRTEWAGTHAEEAKAELAELKTFFPLLLDFLLFIQSGNGWWVLMPFERELVTPEFILAWRMTPSSQSHSTDT